MGLGGTLCRRVGCVMLRFGLLSLGLGLDLGVGLLRRLDRSLGLHDGLVKVDEDGQDLLLLTLLGGRERLDDFHGYRWRHDGRHSLAWLGGWLHGRLLGLGSRLVGLGNTLVVGRLSLGLVLLDTRLPVFAGVVEQDGHDLLVLELLRRSHTRRRRCLGHGRRLCT